MYSTDNGPNMFTWPDAAMTPFRSEKNTNWEGAYRVPCVVRWPGKIKPGTVSNQMVAHHDWLPTFLAMAGDPDIKDKLLQGHTIGEMTYKVHLDGFNLVPYLAGEVEKSPPSGSSTAMTTSSSWQCATTTGSWCFRSSGSPAGS
jgi:arylsulfatase A-like enzyme